MAIDESFSYVHEHLPKGYGYACQLMVRPYKTDSLAALFKILKKVNKVLSQLLQGETHHTIDSGIMTFSNHGCDRSYNYGDEYSSVTESTVDLTDKKIPDGLDCSAIAYSPVQERHLRQIMSAGDVVLRDVRAGDEILVSINVPKIRICLILHFST